MEKGDKVKKLKVILYVDGEECRPFEMNKESCLAKADDIGSEFDAVSSILKEADKAHVFPDITWDDLESEDDDIEAYMYPLDDDEKAHLDLIHFKRRGEWKRSCYDEFLSNEGCSVSRTWHRTWGCWDDQTYKEFKDFHQHLLVRAEIYDGNEKLTKSDLLVKDKRNEGEKDVYTIKYELVDYVNENKWEGHVDIEKDSARFNPDSKSEEAKVLKDISIAIAKNEPDVPDGDFAFGDNYFKENYDEDMEFFEDGETDMAKLMSPAGGQIVLDYGSDYFDPFNTGNLKIEVYDGDKKLKVEDLHIKSKGDDWSK